MSKIDQAIDRLEYKSMKHDCIDEAYGDARLVRDRIAELEAQLKLDVVGREARDE